jgi:broad specificity phosphatase PhoE
MSIVAQIFLIRHGETEWSAAGRHTSHTDVPLSPAGKEQASRLRETLRSMNFAKVFTSPLQRARQTCELAGLADRAQVNPDLHEWDYGAYEGRTSGDIHAQRPGWNLFIDGCPDGESPEQISRRADRVLAGIYLQTGIVALFSHGHFLRALASRWMGSPVNQGQHLAVDPGSVGILGFEHPGSKIPTLCRWNVDPRGLAVSDA